MPSGARVHADWHAAALLRIASSRQTSSCGHRATYLTVPMPEMATAGC